MGAFLRRINILIFLLFAALLATAQSTCTQTLRTARSTYDLGRLNELPGLLEDCLRNGFTGQEKTEAYKLLALTYLYLEEPAKADDAMLSLLRTDPYFQINKEVDPAEFIALYKTFRTNPIYRLGLKLGVNASQPNVTSAIEVTDGESSYTYKISFQFGANIEIPLSDKFTFNPSLLFQQKSFSYNNKVNRGTNAEGKPLFNTAKGQERQTWVSLPLLAQYRIKQGRYNPYVALGASADYLMPNSEITIERSRDDAQAVQERTLTLKRKSFNISGIAAIGAKLRIFGGYFITEAMLQYGILDVNTPATAYENQDLVFSNGYADSVYKLNSLSVTLGYVQNIFNPKKLKRKK
jgi:hypothetical protein